MNIFLVELFILVSLSLFCAWLYSQKPKKEINFFNSISLTQIITSVIPTSLFVIFFVLSYIFIMTNAGFSWNIIDKLVLVILTLFISFGTLGVGIHFTGKCLSELLKHNKDKKIRRGIFIFHMKLGHHITFIFGTLSLFIMAIYNLYHPFLLPASRIDLIIILMLGFLWSISWTFSFVFAPINRSIYIFLTWFCAILLSGLFLLTKNLGIAYFPVSVFYFSVIFSMAILISLAQIIEKKEKTNIGVLLFNNESELDKLYLKNK